MIELTPEREQAREAYRQQIMNYVAGLAVSKQLENPMLSIGMDDEIIS